MPTAPPRRRSGPRRCSRRGSAACATMTRPAPGAPGAGRPGRLLIPLAAAAAVAAVAIGASVLLPRPAPARGGPPQAAAAGRHAGLLRRAELVPAPVHGRGQRDDGDARRDDQAAVPRDRAHRRGDRRRPDVRGGRADGRVPHIAVPVQRERAGQADHPDPLRVGPRSHRVAVGHGAGQGRPDDRVRHLGCGEASGPVVRDQLGKGYLAVGTWSPGGPGTGRTRAGESRRFTGTGTCRSAPMGAWWHSWTRCCAPTRPRGAWYGAAAS